MRNTIHKTLSVRVLLGALVLLVWAPPGSAIFGVRRRTAVVAYSVGASAGASKEAAAASQQQAAAAQQQSAAAQQQAAAQSAAAAQQAAAAAQQAAAAADKAAQPAAQQKTPQQQLQELESLYKQGLISQSDYEAAKQKIINQLTK